MITYYCITHDKQITVTEEVGRYVPTYCEGKTYDREGDTCSWQWESTHHEADLITWLGTKGSRRRLIEAGGGRRP